MAKEKKNQSEMEQYEEYILLKKGAEAELVEKKSRFIATIRPVSTEDEAAAFIEEIKKKYYDARHNCSAFVIGSKAQLTRSSDDGEPSGTAGRPMLYCLAVKSAILQSL
jgi:putative IMPACT (imprinted ancient) family translation regulator